MPDNTRNQLPNIFPALSFNDATKAMEWLHEAFGFEKRAAYEGDDGKIVHAEMSLGNGGIMFGDASHRDPNNPWTEARFGLYVYVEDVDAHYQRAKAAGAEIVRDLNDTDYGAREYSVKDLDGNLWSFGTYLPEWMTEKH